MTSETGDWFGVQCAELRVRYNKCAEKCCNRTTSRLTVERASLRLRSDPVVDFSDDAVLVKALAARDSDAFAYMLDRYHVALVRLAQQYVPSRAVAEEVAQETWLAVIEGIDRFEQRSSLKTWLFRILINIARSHGVKENRSIPFATTTALEAEPAVDPHRFRRGLRARGAWKRPPHPWSEPEQRAVDAETLETIRSAIDRLPPDQREVITMRDLLGWSAAEVCDALEVTDANQRVLLHRGRSKVRASLEQRYDAGRES
jgi:RNA polymerase sigma-70 factor, ECF subfamily